MKKGFVIGLATGLTVAGASLVLANSQIQAILNDQIKVTLNGQVQEFKDETTNETQYPITYHDRTYLPLRTVANLVGVDVDYDANTNTAKLKTSNTKNDIKIDDEYKLELNVPSGLNTSIIHIGESILGRDTLTLRSTKNRSEYIDIDKNNDPNLKIEVLLNPQLVKEDSFIAVAEGCVQIRYSYSYKGKVYSKECVRMITNGENFSNGMCPVISNSLLNGENSGTIQVGIVAPGTFRIQYPDGYYEDNYYKYEWMVEDKNIIEIGDDWKYTPEISFNAISYGTTKIICNISTADGKETIKKVVNVTTK